ncbi:BRCT domain-containing protein [Motilimonas eburnea]|uniref:BRCT domain-containing protein n=1 Tax=Motilimonas eburnea TaxID=1737488 RepID=UPI001E60B96C|nr:BRCT domain-containing protein [Motilimonas eburnea]MCE2571729.1 hypothetical protein [Motilimonas eburnea]
MSELNQEFISSMFCLSAHLHTQNESVPDNTVPFIATKSQPKTETSQNQLLLTGYTVAFTGKMSLPRVEMEEQACAHGAWIGKTVNSTTDILVTGERVGKVTIDKARSLGVSLFTEDEYRHQFNVF